MAKSNLQLPLHRVSEGRAVVWEAAICVVEIVTEGGMDDDGPGSVVVEGVAAEVPVFFFLGVLTL